MWIERFLFLHLSAHMRRYFFIASHMLRDSCISIVTLSMYANADPRSGLVIQYCRLSSRGSFLSRQEFCF